MFDKEYVFHGKHAEIVKRLTAALGPKTKAKVFTTNYDVYAVAPIIGYLYGRRADIDKSSDETTKIFTDKMMVESDNLKFNYRILMLLLNKAQSDEERQRIVFKIDNDDEARAEYDKIYNEYVLGGVEILGEKILADASTVDDYIINAYNFMDEFNNRYYVDISGD